MIDTNFLLVLLAMGPRLRYLHGWALLNASWPAGICLFFFCGLCLNLCHIIRIYSSVSSLALNDLSKGLAFKFSGGLRF